MKLTYEQLEQELAAARQQIEALVAENTPYKDAVNDIAFMKDDDFFNSTRAAQKVMGALVSIKTPATDAAIANFRAQGVDRFAAELGRVYQQLRPASTQAKNLKSVIFRAQVFIGSLRAEASK